MSPLLTPSSERVWSFFRQFILTKAFWNRAIICKLKKKKIKGPAVMQAIFCLGKCRRAGRANPLGARGGNGLGQRNTLRLPGGNAAGPPAGPVRSLRNAVPGILRFVARTTSYFCVWHVCVFPWKERFSSFFVTPRFPYHLPHAPRVPRAPKVPGTRSRCECPAQDRGGRRAPRTPRQP